MVLEHQKHDFEGYFFMISWPIIAKKNGFLGGFRMLGVSE